MKTSARERGAALVEYALIVALVVVGSLGAIKTLRDGSSDRLEERQGSSGGGTELSGQGYSYSGAGGSAGGGGGGGTPSTVTVDSVTFPNGGTKASKDGKDFWIANVTVALKSGTTKVENAVVTVTWTQGTTSNSVQCPLPSDNKGQVECELAGIPNSVTSVTLTVDAVSGSSIAYTSPNPKPSTSVNKP